MSTLPEKIAENNPALLEIVRQLDRAAAAFVGGDAQFASREQFVLTLANEAVRQSLQADLQRRADDYPREVCIAGVTYRQHESGEVAYHSLCGALPVGRHTYREVGVRNGPTIVPLELETGIIERATPALAFNIAQGYAKHDMRSHHEDLLAAKREPPSRTTLEHIAKAIGAATRRELPRIEPAVRRAERVPQEARGLTTGMDRTSVPKEEPRPANQPPKTRRKVRIKAYVRKPPPPVDVNYRMAYVGTVTLHDASGEALVSRRYTALPSEEPTELAARMAADVKHYVAQRPDLNVALLQDGAPELWNVGRQALANIGLTSWNEAIDRYHLHERLGEALVLLPIAVGERQQLLAAWAARLDTDDEAIDDIERALIAWHTMLDPGPAGELWEHLVYLRNNKDRMRYASFIEKGLPVGSGITEAACKSVIGQRTNGSGQRWHDAGLDAALTLRSIHRSERLPAFWRHFSRRYTKVVEAAS